MVSRLSTLFPVVVVCVPGADLWPHFPGSLVTTATWMRSFVRSHPAYKFDSVVSEEINYDLVRAMDEIESGARKAPEFLPSCYQGSGIQEGDPFKDCCGDVMEEETSRT